MITRGIDPVGTGRQIELVAEGFQAAGWHVHLAVTTAGGTVAQRLAHTGVTVHRLSSRPTVDAATVVKVVQRARRLGLGRSDVVLAWGRSQAPLAAAVKVFVPTVRFISHLAVRPRGTIAGLALGKADRVIAASQAVAAACERAGMASGKIDMIPPAATAAAAAGLSRAEIANCLGLDPGTIWTLCVAPLVPEARLERLL